MEMQSDIFTNQNVTVAYMKCDHQVIDGKQFVVFCAPYHHRSIFDSFASATVFREAS
jgi:hypothetical protein